MWNVSLTGANRGSHCENLYIDYSYVEEGDTVIDNVSYNKLYEKMHRTERTFPPGFPLCFYDYGIEIHLLGALRNDSLAKKVFYLPDVVPGKRKIAHFT